MGTGDNVRLDRATPVKDRDASDPWWDGRQVAIRPDVPGPEFDPGDLVLIRTDEERLAAQAGIDKFVDDTKNKSSRELWPRWLWKTDNSSDPDSAQDQKGSPTES